MLLTLYYILSTCIESWRLNCLKNLLFQLLRKNSSIVLYKERKPLEYEFNVNYETLSSLLRGVSSEYCSNKTKAYLRELWFFKSEKRGCAVSPEQSVDISNWIKITPGDIYFPLKLHEIQNANAGEIFLLIEAAFVINKECGDKVTFELENYGEAISWTCNDCFAIIIRTDIEHLTKLCCEFMRSEVYLNSIMQIIRLQTVTVTGCSCELVNADKIPILIYSLTSGNQQPSKDKNTQSDEVDEGSSSADKKEFHIEMLKKVASGAKNLVRSVQGYIDMDYPPVSLVRNGFVRPEATISLSQLIPKMHDRARGEDDTYRSGSIFDTVSSLGACIKEQKKCTASSSLIRSSSAFSFSIESESGSTPKRVGVNHVISINGSVDCSNVINVNRSTDSSPSRSSYTSGRSAGTRSLTSSKSFSGGLRHLGEKKTGKPPNIIIFSESSSSIENIKTSLNNVLRKHRYTVYNLTLDEMLSSPWIEQASLVVVCGNVPAALKPMLLRYLLVCGGHLLCLCSDLLGLILPSFRTAEVRPDEVVSISYETWPQVNLLHHIFCYQPSPKISSFSMDESPTESTPPAGTSSVPRTVELVDPNYQLHTLHVRVLASEKTWQTPTLLLAMQKGAKGKALFSQVHLEVDPPQKESASQLAESFRLLVLSNLLSKYLGLECVLEPTPVYTYQPAYFLGHHETKSQFLQKLAEANAIRSENSELVMKSITLKFCGMNTPCPDVSDKYLPIKLYECPQNFSTVEYFENLKTEKLGRLVVYADIMTSSMEILSGAHPLEHGLVAISMQQTHGVGRSKNAWISPEGCAMFSVQLHIPLDSPLGRNLALVQHVVALSIVSGIRSQPGYEDLPLGLKWPNDIYVDASAKIGGLVIASSIYGQMAICNAGCGVNLNNSHPTTCINDIIDEMNKTCLTKVPKLSLEKYFALVFTELERLMNSVSEQGTDEIFDLYYKYWLHNLAEVKITKSDKSCQLATIIGLDDYGFLKVRGETGDIFSVHPDGNTFDMLSGLIAPK